MPYARSGGVRLHFEEAGSGTPLIFVHEFSGDMRSWEAQMRHFARRYRCIAFNARGYPPSDVPKRAASYSWQLAADDIGAVLDHLGVRRAHVVGCSMGAYSAIQFGLRHPQRVLSVTAVGAGAGSVREPERRAAFLAATEANARRFLEKSMPEAVRSVPPNPGRIPLLVKDARGFAEFMRVHESHSAQGLAHVQRGVQATRPPIYDLEPQLRAWRVPFFIVSGDEDDNCLGPAVFMKSVCPTAKLFVAPGAGHTVNTEEPALFNQLLLDFLTSVDTGAWRPRDPRSVAGSTAAKQAGPAAGTRRKR